MSFKAKFIILGVGALASLIAFIMNLKPVLELTESDLTHLIMNLFALAINGYFLHKEYLSWRESKRIELENFVWRLHKCTLMLMINAWRR